MRHADCDQKDQMSEFGAVEFGDAADLRRSTTVRYGYVCREIFERCAVS